jgi:lysophospholipase L1-like esterase
MTQIQFRRGTASAWTTAATVLAQGELGFETDTKKVKVGDGSTAWPSLPYVAETMVDNADGTMAIGATNVSEPLTTVTIANTSAAPAIGQSTWYNAASGNLTPTLPALSGLRVGARLAVRRDPADASANTVTLSCAGSDTFYSSAATSATFPMSGEQREFQVISVSGTKYWAPSGAINPVAALDNRYHSAQIRPGRNTIAALGDSITWWGNLLGYGPSIGQNYLQQLQVMTHQRIRYAGADFAISGSNLNSALTVQLPQVVAMNPLPGACVVASASNDLDQVSSPNPNFTAMKTTLKSIVAGLLNAGIAPILWCVPPNNFGGSPSTYQANIHQWNSWIRRYASLNGFAVIDAHTACAAIDGTYISGLGQSDLIHPTGAGQRAIAQQAISDGVADMFPPNSLVHTARQTNDLSNLFNNGTINLGLFTTDTNSDGVADGLTASGAGTFSLVTPLASDNLYGKWQQMTASTGQTPSLQASITTGWSVGDVIAFSCRVQTQNIEAAGAVFDVCLLTDTPGGFTPPGGSSVTALYNGIENWTGDAEDGELYVELTVLSAMTDMKLLVWLPSVTSGTATVRVGEVTIRNLTTGGLLT